MAEHEPPADLIDKLAEAQRAEGWWCGVCDFDDPPCPGCVGSYTATAHAVLTALAVWADGALIDPATWARVRSEEVFAPEVTDLPLHMLTREDVYIDKE